MAYPINYILHISHYYRDILSKYLANDVPIEAFVLPQLETLEQYRTHLQQFLRTDTESIELGLHKLQEAFNATKGEKLYVLHENSRFALRTNLRYSKRLTPALPIDKELLDFSLSLEFGVIAALIITKENMGIENSKLDELNNYIVNMAQSFGAKAISLLPLRVPIAPHYAVITTEDDALAEMGLTEFLSEL